VRTVVILGLLLTACGGPELFERERTEFAFGSYFRVKLLAGGEAEAESSLARAFSRIHRLDTLWSAFLPGSEVARVNRLRRAGVSSETRALVETALGFGDVTGGALDVTVAPLVEAWGFPDGRYRVPDSSELMTLLSGVDYRKVSVRGDSLLLEGGVRLDLGAVAVGNAVDRAVEGFIEEGIEQGLVDAGGDIRVFGDRDWRIGLQDPRGDGVVRVFELRNRAISTSGDYQKFFERNGKRYCHIVDPATGRPACHFASVTVLAPSALTADAYSTALFVMGVEGMGLFEAEDSLAAVVLVPIGDSLQMLEAGSP